MYDHVGWSVAAAAAAMGQWIAVGGPGLAIEGVGCNFFMPLLMNFANPLNIKEYIGGTFPRM
jgi:hypothetical protein